MKKVRVFILLLIFAMASCMAGCNIFPQSGKVSSSKNSKKITITMMQGAWVGTARGTNDPYQKWIEKTFKVNFKLTADTHFSDQVMVRFSSGEAPDIISYYDKNVMMNLYDQGVLVSDWNKYKNKIPTIIKGMSIAQVHAVTRDGMLTMVSAPSDPATFSFKIRKDWLANLGLSVPTTPNELLNVARKFTYNDPDKDGKNDTYAFTSAGGRASVGEIANLVWMWGPKNFYISANNQVSHPIVDGNWKKFLDFMRIIVKEKLIDPDWFTISWNDRKPKLYNGTYGICVYPGVLANETENGSGNTGKTAGWWETMATPRGSAQGGKIDAGLIFESIRTVSASAAKDREKMNRILQIFESTAYPNDGFYKLRWGVGIDGFKLKGAGNGYSFINSLGKEGINKRGAYNGGNLGLYDWGYSIATRMDKVLEGSSDVMDKATQAQLAMDIASSKLPTYGSEGQVFTLDSTIKSQLDLMEAAFDYRYILGQTGDYEGFKASWLKAGGQKLLDNATEQAKKLGMLK